MGDFRLFSRLWSMSFVPEPTSPLRLVVVDDELTSRAGLIRMLDQLPDVHVVGEAGDVSEAIHVVESTVPDGLLLDIQLPTGTGFDVLAGLARPLPFVFVTAFHAHAITAFELAALDYLLKPFAPERLQTAVERLRRSVLLPESVLGPQLRAMQQLISGEQPVDRVFVRRGRRIVMLDVDDILRIEADGMYTRIVTGADVFVATIPLTTILTRLPTDRFVRVHRSHIVNFRYATGFSALANGRLQVGMRKGPPVPCSREYSKTIRHRAW